MRIERVTDLNEVLKLLPFEREIKKKGREGMKESNILLFIQAIIKNPLFGCFIAYDEEGKVNGYTFGMINLLPGGECLNIFRMYAKKPDVFMELENVLKEWGKMYHIKKGVMTVRKHIKAFQRKYKYVPVSVNMERKYF